jgi:hypothetical protein
MHRSTTWQSNRSSEPPSSSTGATGVPPVPIDRAQATSGPRLPTCGPLPDVPRTRVAAGQRATVVRQGTSRWKGPTAAGRDTMPGTGNKLPVAPRGTRVINRERRRIPHPSVAQRTREWLFLNQIPHRHSGRDHRQHVLLIGNLHVQQNGPLAAISSARASGNSAFSLTKRPCQPKPRAIVTKSG